MSKTVLRYLRKVGTLFGVRVGGFPDIRYSASSATPESPNAVANAGMRPVPVRIVVVICARVRRLPTPVSVGPRDVDCAPWHSAQYAPNSDFSSRSTILRIHPISFEFT